MFNYYYYIPYLYSTFFIHWNTFKSALHFKSIIMIDTHVKHNNHLKHNNTNVIKYAITDRGTKN